MSRYFESDAALYPAEATEFCSTLLSAPSLPYQTQQLIACRCTYCMTVQLLRHCSDRRLSVNTRAQKVIGRFHEIYGGVGRLWTTEKFVKFWKITVRVGGIAHLLIIGNDNRWRGDGRICALSSTF